MTSLADWNQRQARVLGRYCKSYGIAVTPDLWIALATRYAAKHAEARLALTTRMR